MEGRDGAASWTEMAALSGGPSSWERPEGSGSVATLPPAAPPAAESLAVCTAARRYLYASHGAAQFSEGAWQFTVALVLAACTDYRSLVLLSTYGVAGSLATGFGVAPLGSRLDAAATGKRGSDGGRLRLARWLIGLENAAVIIATVAGIRLLAHHPSPPSTDDRHPSGSGDDDDGAEEAFASGSGWWRRAFRHVPLEGWQPIVWLVLVHALGSLAQMLDQAFLVAMERDWIVVLSHAAARAGNRDDDDAASEGSGPGGDGAGAHNGPATPEFKDARRATLSAWLSDTNVTMKQIDLTCKVMAPAVIGFLVPGGGPPPPSDGAAMVPPDDIPGPGRPALQALCAAVGILNAAALVVEYVCTARVYHWIPELQRGSVSRDMALSPRSRPTESDQEPETLTSYRDDDAEEVEEHLEDEEHPVASATAPPEHSPVREEPPLPCGSEWAIYWRQPCAGAGLALALLYANALTFGNGVLTAYLLSRGLAAQWIGLWRGVAAVVGLFGTCAFPWAVRHFRSLEGTALSSVLFQLACLGAALASVLWLAPTTATTTAAAATLSLALLIAGVCLSRVGLWVFDIAVTQMQQEEAPGGVRGRVGAVQQSLNALFRNLSFVPGLVYPNPDDFPVCVAAAVVGVGLSALSFVVGVYRPRFWRRSTHRGRPQPVRQSDDDDDNNNNNNDDDGGR